MASLVELCARRAVEVMRQDGSLWQLGSLPLELLRIVLPRLSPLDCYYLELGRKRTDYDPGVDQELQLRWKLFMESHHSHMRNYKELRPGGQADWRQLYWEAHVQDCLDSVAASRASVVYHQGGVVDDILPEVISKRLGSRDLTWTLQNTLSLFGSFAKTLRIQSLLCVDELFDLLQAAESRALAFYHVRDSEQFRSALRMVLSKSNTLRSLEFWHCRISGDQACSLFQHIQSVPALSHFAIMSSRIPPMSQELGEFLQRSRSVRSLQLSNNRTSVSSAGPAIMLEILNQTSTNLSRIEVDELPIIKFPVADQVYLPCVKYLDLRCCSLDAPRICDLLQYLGRLQALETLGLSDNPLGDEGIRSLSSFVQASSSLRSLFVNCCGFSWHVAVVLLRKALKLKVLSISDNSLGDLSHALAEYVTRSAVEVLEIEGIGLGQFACNSSALLSALTLNRSLAHLNISKNRIGLNGARLLHDVICKGGGNLTSIDASYNLFSEEALRLLADAVQANAKTSRPAARLRHLDLRGNSGAQSSVIVLFEPFSSGPEPVVLLSGHETILHDDDP